MPSGPSRLVTVVPVSCRHVFGKYVIVYYTYYTWCLGWGESRGGKSQLAWVGRLIRDRMGQDGVGGESSRELCTIS